jgi:hypothetical protein
MYTALMMLDRMYTAEPLIPEPNSFEVEKLKSYKLPIIDLILAELIQAGGNILFSEIFCLD